MGLLDSLRARLHRNTRSKQGKPPTGEEPEKKSGKKPLPEKRYRKPEARTPTGKARQESKKKEAKKKKIDWGKILNRIANEQVISGLDNLVGGFNFGAIDFNPGIDLGFVPSSGEYKPRRRPRRRHGRRRGGRGRRR